MKTGIVRRIDDLGRIVIPKEVRQKLDIHEGDALELSIEGNKICFEAYIFRELYADRISRLIELLKEDRNFVSNKKSIISALEIAKELLSSDNTAEETAGAEQ